MSEVEEQKAKKNFKYVQKGTEAVSDNKEEVKKNSEHREKKPYHDKNKKPYEGKDHKTGEGFEKKPYEKRAPRRHWKKDLVITLESVIPELPKKTDRLTAPNEKHLDEELERIENKIKEILENYVRINNLE